MMKVALPNGTLIKWQIVMPAEAGIQAFPQFSEFPLARE